MNKIKSLLSASLIIQLLVLSCIYAGVHNSTLHNQYVFKMNDEVFRPTILSLDGGDEPKAGDVAVIGMIGFVLDGPKTYSFENELEKEGCLYLLNADGSKSIIAVRIATVTDVKRVSSKDPNRIKKKNRRLDGIDTNFPGAMGMPNSDYEMTSKSVNPLASLSTVQIQKIRGIKIENWDDNVAKLIKLIDPSRTCITIYTSEKQDTTVLNSLPKGLQYLSVCYFSETAVSKLSLFPQLKFLIVDDFACELDAAKLKNNINLQYLSFMQYEPKFSNLEALGSLKALNVLAMPNTQNFKEIAFTAPLKQLRFLDISDTNVTDLSCLGKLDELREVRANKTPVTILPKGKLPNLETLWVMQAKLTPKQVQAFESDHSNCIVVDQWNRSLPRLLKEATSVDVGDFIFPDQSHTNLTDANTDSVQQLIKHLQVDPCELDAGTLCSADFCLAFYSDNKPLEMFEIVCSGNIRWKNAEPHEVMLTMASGDYLANWLDKRGFGYMLEERKKQAEKYNAAFESMKKEFRDFLSVMPQDISKALSTEFDFRKSQWQSKRRNMTYDVAEIIEGQEVSDLIKNTLKTQIPDDQHRAELCFKILSKYWESNSFYRYTVSNILKDIEKYSKEKAVNSLIHDPNANKGITFWLLEIYGWEEIDPNLVEHILPTVTSIALSDPERMHREKAIRTLGQIKVNASKEILLKILKNEIIFPTEEPLSSFDVNSPVNRGLYRFSYAALAASSLTRFGDVNTLPLISEMSKSAKGNDKRMFDMAIQQLNEINAPPKHDSNERHIR